MKIKPNQDFKHDKDHFRKGREYTVTTELGNYFKSNGWVGEKKPPQDVSIDIQDGKHVQRSK